MGADLERTPLIPFIRALFKQIKKNGLCSATLVLICSQDRFRWNLFKFAFFFLLVTMQPGAVFGPNSQTLTCPYCHQEVTTVVKPEASTKTHIIAVLLCLVWCILIF